MLFGALCLFFAIGCGPDAKASLQPGPLLIVGDFTTIDDERLVVEVRLLNYGAVATPRYLLTVDINERFDFRDAPERTEVELPAVEPRGPAVVAEVDVTLDGLTPDRTYYLLAQIWNTESPREGNPVRWDTGGFALDDDGAVTVRCTRDDGDGAAGDDPYTGEQWNLENTGQRAFATNPGIAGQDLGMDDVLATAWPTGSGVHIAIADTGLDVCHPDLAANVEADASRNFNADIWQGATVSDPFLPSTVGDHGTSVAGVAGAAANNASGGRGVAPDVRLRGYNVLSAIDFWPAYVSTLGGSLDDETTTEVDIVNMSFGSLGGDDNLHPLQRDIFVNGVTKGRHERGVVYVKSAGNSYASCRSMRRPVNAEIGCGAANGDSTSNTPWTIVVGGFSASGTRSSYSAAGANLWVSAPSGEFGRIQPAQITTDQHGLEKGYDVWLRVGLAREDIDGAYISTFTGTSAAAPNASGAIALLLEAYPTLTWRDVKHILAKTARQIDPDIAPVRYLVGEDVYTLQLPWTMNDAGYNYHNWYGFGAIAVDDALDYAGTFAADGLGDFMETAPLGVSQPARIPDHDGTGIAQTLRADGDSIPDGATIEAVTLHVDITHPFTNDLGIHLISPSGTESILNPAYNEVLAGDADLDWRLLSNAFYGESPTGEWTIRVIDAAPGDVGMLNSWSLEFALGAHPD